MPAILLATICSVAFTSLFIGQLQLAARQKILYKNYQQAISGQPKNIIDVLKHLHSDYNSSVRVEGTPLNNEQFLLFDQYDRLGQQGIEVITPLQINQAILLVDRGFVPWRNLQQKPKLTPLISPWVVEGIIFYPTIPLVQSKTATSSLFYKDSSPRWMKYLSFEDLSAYLQKPIPKVTLLLSPNDPQGFERVWQPKPPLPDEAYHTAVPWGVFSILSLSYCAIWVYHYQMRKKQLEQQQKVHNEQNKKPPSTNDQ